MTPRGIRNNNPGNIEYNGTLWRGLAMPPSDGRFCVFIAPQWGIRALAVLLRNYSRNYGINTIQDAINRFAPATENDTTAYIAAVAGAVGVSPNVPINWCDNNDILAKMVRAIIKHENGQMPYSDEQIDLGLNS